MIQLLVIADDLTGALDTGIRFDCSKTLVRIGQELPADISGWGETIQVLILDAETRHLPPNRAYEVVYQIADRARQLKIPFIYKKTIRA